MDKPDEPESTWKTRLMTKPTRGEVIAFVVLFAILYGLLLWAVNSPAPKEPAEVILHDDGTA